MGMMSALVRGPRGRATASNVTKREQPALESLREATLDEGVKQIIATINELIDLDERFADIEKDLIGKSPITLERVPSPEELGLTGFVPRLMEAALLIGAVTRRMHLRVGVVEGALGMRARPIMDLTGDFGGSEELQSAVQPAPTVETAETTKAIDSDVRTSEETFTPTLAGAVGSDD